MSLTTCSWPSFKSCAAGWGVRFEDLSSAFRDIAAGQADSLDWIDQFELKLHTDYDGVFAADLQRDFACIAPTLRARVEKPTLAAEQPALSVISWSWPSLIALAIGWNLRLRYLSESFQQMANGPTQGWIDEFDKTLSEEYTDVFSEDVRLEFTSMVARLRLRTDGSFALPPQNETSVAGLQASDPQLFSVVPNLEPTSAAAIPNTGPSQSRSSPVVPNTEPISTTTIPTTTPSDSYPHSVVPKPARTSTNNISSINSSGSINSTAATNSQPTKSEQRRTLIARYARGNSDDPEKALPASLLTSATAPEWPSEEIAPVRRRRRQIASKSTGGRARRRVIPSETD